MSEEKKDFNKIDRVTLDDSFIEYEILDHEIRELYSQALYDEVSYVCVYFPTKVTITKGEPPKLKRETKYDNIAHIVAYDFKKPVGMRKRKIAITEPWLTANFRVNVKESWSKVAWPYKNFREWLDTNEQTNPTVLFDKINSVLHKYLDMPDKESYIVLALWIIGTYFYRMFDAYPYLDFIGTKRAGKTKVLELIKQTSFNSVMSPDMTGSVVFRLVEQTGCTLLFDEAEYFKNQKSETAQHIRTLLMQGFMKDQFAYRTNKDSMKVEGFNLYSPKAMGHISFFDDVLEDRCIKLLMKRTINKEIQNSHPNSDNPIFVEIRDLAYRTYLENANNVTTWSNIASESMLVYGREKLLWHPIMTMAIMLEGFGMTGLRESVIEYTNRSHEDRQITDESSNTDIKIARYVADTFESDTWYVTKALYGDLIAKGEDYDIKAEYLSMRAFTNTLRRLGVIRAKKEDGINWMVTKDDLSRIRTTYLDESGISSVSASSSVSSVSRTNLTNKPEPTERTERTEPKALPAQTTLELNQLNELNQDKKDLSSVSASSSGFDLANIEDNKPFIASIGVDDEWETPRHIFEQAKISFKIHPSLDTAASEKNTKCERFFTKEQDGLRHAWKEDFFCNPPYSNVEDWVRKAYREHQLQKVTGMMLIFSKTDTKWWHECIEGKAEVHPIKGRVKFCKDGVPSVNSAPYPSCWVIWRSK